MDAIIGIKLRELSATLTCGGDGADPAALSLRDMSLEGPAARDAALRLGAVTTFLPFLRRDYPPHIQKLVAQAISNWCRHVDGEPAVRVDLVSPALPLIADLLRQDDEQLQEVACTAVMNLTHGSHDGIYAVQAVPMFTTLLVARMKNEAVLVKRAALSAVANMLAGSLTQVKCYIEAGCLDPIITHLQSSDTFLVQHAARAAANIFTHPNLTLLALNRDFHPLLRRVLEKNKEPACQKQAARAISNLCYYGSAAQCTHVLSSGVLQPYCALLAGPDHTLAALVLGGLNALVQAAEKEDGVSENERKMKPLCLKLDQIGVLDFVRQLLQQEGLDEDLRCQATELIIAVHCYSRNEDLVSGDGIARTPADIVRDLESGELVRQVRAARAARRMLCRARGEGPARLEEASRVMVGARAIPRLVAALHNDTCSDLQTDAVWALTNITYEKEHTMAVVKCRGAVPKLVSLLAKEGDVAVHAAITLGNLTSGARDVVLYHGAVGAMLPYLRPGTPNKMLKACVETYRKLCKNHYVNGWIAFHILSVALPCMSELVSRGGNDDVKEAAFGALKRLAYRSHEGRDAIQVEPGLTARLVSQLRYSHRIADRTLSVTVNEGALRVVASLLAGYDYHAERCLDDGCLDHIMCLLQSSKASLQAQAFRAMRYILHRPHLIQRALDKDVLTPLLSLLADDVPWYKRQTQVQAAWAIANICQRGSIEQRAQVVSRGVVERCSALLAARDTTPAAEPSAGRDDLTQTLWRQKRTEKVCRILKYITKWDEYISVVQAVPGLTARLVALLAPSATSPSAQGEAFGTLINMLSGTDAQTEQCVGAGCLEHISWRLRSGNPALQSLAAQAVGNVLAGTTSQIQRALDADVLIKLEDMLLYGESKYQLLAARAIGNALQHGSAAQRAQVVTREYVLDACSALLAARDTTDVHRALTEQVCRILEFVMKSEHHIETVQKLGVTARLMALLDYMEVAVQKAAMGAVINMLAGNHDQTERCLAAGCLEHVLRFLCDWNREPELASLAAQAAANVFAGTHSQIQRALDTDFINALGIMVEHGQQQNREEAMCAIGSLCFNGSAAQRYLIVDTGVLEPCCALLQNPDHTVVEEVLDVLDKLLESACDGEMNMETLSSQLRRYGVLEQLQTLVEHVNIADGTFTELVALLAGGGEGAERAARTFRDMSVEGPAARVAALRLGAVQALLPHLQPHTPLQILTLLVQAVSNWCRRADDAPAVHLALVEPVLPLLKDLLHHGDPDVLEAACMTIANVSHGPSDRTAAVQAVPGLTEHLVAHLEHEATHVRAAALRAVANILAGTSTQVEACLDAGCLDPIILLLRSSDAFLVEHAARATANIFTHARATAKALDLDVLAPLPNVLANGTDKCQKQAARAISNLCYYGTAAQCTHVLSSGVLQPYCALLAGPDHTLAALVLGGLNALVQAAERDCSDDNIEENSDPDSENQLNDDSNSQKWSPLLMKLSELNVLDLLEQLLQRQEINEGLRRRALELSVNIRFYTKKEDVVYEDGKILTPADIVQEVESAELARQVGAARAARRLLCGARAQGPARLWDASHVMVRAGVLPPLVAALGNDNFDLQHEAVRALSILASEQRCIKAVVEAKAIPKLVILLLKKGQVGIHAAIALGNIASNGAPKRDEVLNNGGVEAMLPSMDPETPPRRLRAFVATYEKLCHLYKEAVDFDQVSPALPVISQLLCSGDHKVLVSACGILIGMTYGAGYDSRIARVQAVPRLVARLGALLTHTAPEVQIAALSTVANMLCGTYTQVECCVKAGYLEHIVSFLQCNKPALVKEAARTTGIVFGHASHSQIQLALEKGILPPLQNILINGEPTCQDSAVWASIKLYKYCSAEQRKPLVCSGLLQRCCQLLASPHVDVLTTLLDGLKELLEVEDRVFFKAIHSDLTALGVRDKVEKFKSKHSKLETSEDRRVFLRARDLLAKFM